MRITEVSKLTDTQLIERIAAAPDWAARREILNRLQRAAMLRALLELDIQGLVEAWRKEQTLER